MSLYFYGVHVLEPSREIRLLPADAGDVRRQEQGRRRQAHGGLRRIHQNHGGGVFGAAGGGQHVGCGDDRDETGKQDSGVLLEEPVRSTDVALLPWQRRRPRTAL